MVKGNFYFPGVIDDQVHFREPGLTHKATIYTEAKAAVAGGVTSFMEMPNTCHRHLHKNYWKINTRLLRKLHWLIILFTWAPVNDNADEVMRTNEKKKDVCGIKIFMGSSPAICWLITRYAR